jgi:hypothetical protein
MDYKKLTFTFKMQYLFDVAKLRSAYIATHTIGQDGTTQERNLAITNSDSDLWNVSIRYPANKVYDYLISAGKVKAGDYQYNVPAADGSLTISYTLYIHPDWDTNLSRGLNDMIEKAIVSGGLADWFKENMNLNAYQAIQAEYEESLRECKGNINRRKSMPQRPHNTF